MSEQRDHYHHNYHRSNNRDSPSSRRSSAASSNSTAPSYNGGGQHLKSMPAATMRNSSPSSAVSPSAVANLSEDLAHLNLPGDVTVGSTVQCTLAQSNRVFKGEVMAFDPNVKAIIIRSTATCSRTSLNDVHILNLSVLKEFKILNDTREQEVADPPSLNVARLQNRLREQVERKKRLVMAFKAGITPEGQKLFQAIGKTIDEIVWNGENIVVLREVTITPPYKPENVKGNTDSKALKHVKKIVEKHINDQFLLSKQQQETARGNFAATSDIVVVHNNNNNKSETSPSTAASPNVTASGPQHQSATRTGSTGRFEESKSGGGARSQRPAGGPNRPSTQKRDYDGPKTMYTQ